MSGGARACTGADVIPRMPTLGRYARGCGEPPSHRSSPPARLPAAYPTPTRALPRACVRACWCVKTSTACVCCVLTGRSRLSREPTSSSSVAAVKSVEIPACGSRCARPQPRVLAQHVPACACACACACTCAYMHMYLHVHAQSPAPSPAESRVPCLSAAGARLEQGHAPTVQRLHLRLRRLARRLLLDRAGEAKRRRRLGLRARLRLRAEG